MTERQWIQQIRDRIRLFKSIPGVRIPLYDSHAGIDFGRYLGIIREDAYWRTLNVDLSRSELSPLAGERADIAQHVVRSVQEIEDLVNIIDRLSIENRILKGKLRTTYQELHNLLIKKDVQPVEIIQQFTQFRTNRL